MTTATKGMRKKMGPRLRESTLLTPSGRGRRELTQRRAHSLVHLCTVFFSKPPRASHLLKFVLAVSTGFLARLLMNVSAISANCSSAFPNGGPCPCPLPQLSSAWLIFSTPSFSPQCMHATAMGWEDVSSLPCMPTVSVGETFERLLRDSMTTFLTAFLPLHFKVLQ